MEAILVAVDEPSENTHVLESAVQRAEREGKTLLAANILPEAAYLARRGSATGTRNLRQDGLTYTYTQACTESQARLERELRRLVGEREVAFEVIGDVGDLVSTALEIAERNNCSTVLVEETPTGLWTRLGLFRTRFPGSIIRVPRPPATA